MVQTLALGKPQTIGEEIANSLSHGIGLLAAVAAVPVLVLAAIQRGGAPGIVGASVRNHDGIDVPHIHALPHLAKEQGQAGIPSSGSRGDLPPDRWNVHAVRVGCTQWCVGLTLLGLEWGLAISGVVLKVFWGYDTQGSRRACI